jgi:hypothetical protein
MQCPPPPRTVSRKEKEVKDLYVEHFQYFLKAEEVFGARTTNICEGPRGRDQAGGQVRGRRQRPEIYLTRSKDDPFLRRGLDPIDPLNELVPGTEERIECCVRLSSALYFKFHF